MDKEKYYIVRGDRSGVFFGNIEYEQELIENGLVEGSVLTDLGYNLTLKSYREEVEKLAKEELE